MKTEYLMAASRNDLAAIYDACREIDLSSLQIPSQKMGFLCLAIHKVAKFINETGHDGSDLHFAITNFIIDLTRYHDVRVALAATYALEDHGLRPTCVLDRLRELVASERRTDDHPIVTSRGIAFGILKRLHADVAMQYLDSGAYEDYRNTINYWLDSRTATWQDGRCDLLSEKKWIDSQQYRRTTD